MFYVAVSISDYLTIINIFVTLLLGVVAIYVAIMLSKRDQNISGFDSLLTRAQRQLDILEQLREKTDSDATQTEKRDKHIFYFTVFKIQNILSSFHNNNNLSSSYYIIPEQDKLKFLEEIKITVDSILHNRYFISNATIFDKWTSLYTSICDYEIYMRAKEMYAIVDKREKERNEATFHQKEIIDRIKLLPDAWENINQRISDVKNFTIHFIHDSSPELKEKYQDIFKK